LGYDTHKLGFAHQPEAPLKPGDVLHLNLYWRAEAPPQGEWQLEIVLLDGGEGQRAAIAAEPVPGYATSRWQAGDVWRGQFDLPIPGDAAPGRYRLKIQPLAPDGSRPEPFLAGPLPINR
jgi:hypothetical protein